MSGPRISYVEPRDIKDPEMLKELERCASIGTPRPESQSIRAHVPAIFFGFGKVWRDAFYDGVLDNAVKELCRIYVSHSVKCEYCGNQRSVKAQGVVEADYMDLLNFEKSERYDQRQKAALAYAEAITWDLPTDDALWKRLHASFSEPELVELGFFIALTMGQQRWLRTLNIDHHQIMPGSAAGMASGLEDAEGLEDKKSSKDYWAKDKLA
ncbi:MAG: carboxymuconolactone decarboxylase [Gammaproteobacteria bacterium]